MQTSGLRLGTPAVTTRGFKEPEVVQLANWICDALDAPTDASALQRIKEQAMALCQRFPVYQRS
jgi:glycine hydroxymethyltransferase